MTGQDSSNRLQGRATGPAALTPRVRREMETRSNVFAEDDSIVVTPTARGNAIRGIPNVVASMVWDADTKIATVNFDYLLVSQIGHTVRKSAHDYVTDLDGWPLTIQIAENAQSHTVQGSYTIDVSAVPASNYGVISFYVPNYYTDLNDRQVWGVPGFDEPLILVDNYANGAGIVATRTYTVDGIEVAGEAVNVRHKNSHAAAGDAALEEYRQGRDAFETGHYYLCSLVIDARVVAGAPVVAWLFGHQGRTRTVYPRWMGWTWNPSTLTIEMSGSEPLNHQAITAGHKITPPASDVMASNSYTFSSGDQLNASVGLYYDAGTGKLVFGEDPGGVYYASMLGFDLEDGEIRHIYQGTIADWYPGLIAVAGAGLYSKYEIKTRNINAAGNRQLDTLTIDAATGRAYFIAQDEDTTTPDQTIDVFASNGDRMRLTMVGEDLYTVASRTPSSDSVDITLDDDDGGTTTLEVHNTGVVIPTQSTSISFI